MDPSLRIRTFGIRDRVLRLREPVRVSGIDLSSVANWRVGEESEFGGEGVSGGGKEGGGEGEGVSDEREDIEDERGDTLFGVLGEWSTPDEDQENSASSTLMT